MRQSESAKKLAVHRKPTCLDSVEPGDGGLSQQLVRWLLKRAGLAGGSRAETEDMVGQRWPVQDYISRFDVGPLGVGFQMSLELRDAHCEKRAPGQKKNNKGPLFKRPLHGHFTANFVQQ